jgi:hypothetical protein
MIRSMVGWENDSVGTCPDQRAGLAGAIEYGIGLPDGVVSPSASRTSRGECGHEISDYLSSYSQPAHSFPAFFPIADEGRRRPTQSAVQIPPDGVTTRTALPDAQHRTSRYRECMETEGVQHLRVPGRASEATLLRNVVQ